MLAANVYAAVVYHEESIALHRWADAFLSVQAAVVFIVFFAAAWRISLLQKHLCGAQMVLRQKETQIATVLDHLPDLVWLKNKDLKYLVVNRAFREQCGKESFLILGKKASEIWQCDTPEKLDEEDQTVLLTGKTIHHETRITDLDGSFVWMEVIKGPAFNDKGQSAGIVGIARNIADRKHAESERKELETQLRQSQKMEAIGTLAGGIAHDFNNILAAMMGYAEILLEETGQDGKIRQRLERILKAGQRGKELVEQILTFSRQNKKEKKPLRLCILVEEALKMLRPVIPRNIEIRSFFTESVSAIMADSTSIHQILINLCTNSSYAMREKGGTLELRVEEIALGVEDALRYIGLDPGPYVRLTVSDTGCGFDGKIKERVFEPFFTTKRQGEGTGMGLSVVHGIVKNMKGMILVDSQPEQGTTFQIYIPAIDAVAAGVETRNGLLSRGNECILLVDDEIFIVDMAKEMLESLGYEVLPFTSSVSALECFRQNKDRIHLVLTDQTMPHMTGESLSKELIRIHPEIPIILCTGFSETVSAEKAKSMGIRDYLMKPFIKRDLAERIRGVLDNRTD